MIRELLFRRTQVLSVLCERRSAFQPYGLQGKQEVLKMFMIVFVFVFVL